MECRLTIDHRPSDNDEATVNDGRQVRVKNPQKIFRTMVAGITSAIRDDVEGIGIRGGGSPTKGTWSKVTTDTYRGNVSL